jgi:hypothetical protein
VQKDKQWHSVKDGTKYHDNDKCTEGNNIEPENYREGKGGRPLCKPCADLDRQGL